MKQTIEKFFLLPTATRLMIAGGCLFSLVVIYWLLLYSGISDKLAENEKAVNDSQTGLKAKMAELEGIRRNMDRFRLEAEKLEVELTQAKQELPNKGEIGMLLSGVSDKAQDSGLEVKSFKPQGEVKYDYYASQPVALEVQGSFHEIATFFDEVGRLPRIVNLDSFQIKDSQVGESEVQVTSTVVATAFRFLDEAERPQKEEKKAKGRKGKGSGSEEEL